MRAPAPSLRPISGAPVFEREVHDLVDLLGEHLTEGAAEHGEVLAEHEHFATIDRAPPCDDAVGIRTFIQASVVSTVTREHVEFVEAAVVEEILDALASQQLAFGMLALDRTL